ncbi:MAG: hypothetical protein HN584_07450 [Akkermansiaceae bacterium]|jgi:hypothetical protein|nr:hypothetical protein [Akkermansiaceae bacterium]
MKIFLIFATALGFIVSAQAQTTLQNVDVGGQLYDITYRNSVSFDDYQTTIDDAPWFTDGGAASDFATAANTANLRFAYMEMEIAGTDSAFYYTTGGNTYDASTNAANYAVSAVAVPAPFPILGILPIVGFLKRMRRRQKAS